VFTAIFLSLIVAAWLFLAFIPWLAWSVATRGNAGLGMLPLCLLAGVVAGLAVPLLGLNDEWGLLWSAAACVVASAGLLAARRLAAKAGDGQPRDPC
jgi:hypothetical protein